MPSKFICSIPYDQLFQAYIVEGRTLQEMCDIIGVKNVITAAKILREKGIETNSNVRKKEKSMI